MLRTIIIICFLFLLSACGDKKKKEMVDIHDLIDSSERYAEGKDKGNDSLIVHWFDSLSVENQMISDTLGLSRKGIELLDSVWLPDRFVHKSNAKWYEVQNDIRKFAAVWNFSDSLSMKNAFFNWLDCFGDRCNTIRLYEEKKLINSAFLLIAFERKMIYLESNGVMNTKVILQNMSRLYPKAEVKYVMTQANRGKVLWWKLEDKKWSIIEKIEL